MTGGAQTILASARLRVDVDGHTATITLTDAARLNAIDDEYLIEVREAARCVAARSGIRVTVLTSSSKFAFSTGADPDQVLASLGSLPADAGEAARVVSRRLARVQEAVGEFESLAMPVVAALTGHAIGAGLQLALACDFRLTVDGARFGLPETAIGLCPELGSGRRLLSLVGLPAARDLILTGRTIDAGHARDIGLVDRVFPSRAELREGVRELAGTLAANAPLAVRQAKKMISELTAPTAADLARERQLAVSCLLSRDVREGFAARRDERPPDFAGS